MVDYLRAALSAVDMGMDQSARKLIATHLARNPEVALMAGDNRKLLPLLPENSVDAIITDPPYELGFMGKKWDGTGIAHTPEVWAMCLRVLKPGGHLLSFGGTRTYHRMASAVEDAGFEVRDMVQWLYGSGFPKSMDMGKAIDKALGAEGAYGAPKSAAHAGWIERGRMRGEEGGYEGGTEEAREWNGWGTALKPANEPIVLARKPFKGTVAGNVLEHGTGGLNIDEARVGFQEGEVNPSIARYNSTAQVGSHGWEHKNRGGRFDEATEASMEKGRWPANVILDKEAGLILDKQTGSLRARGNINPSTSGGGGPHTINPGPTVVADHGPGDAGGPSRFFYCPKTSKSERNAGLDLPNTHPTVKPIALMSYLITLITPPGGIVLDPFLGSGSTGIAARMGGWRFIGIDDETQAPITIAKKRIEHWEGQDG